MKFFTKIFAMAFLAVGILASCDEMDPVLNPDNDKFEPEEEVTLTPNMTIQDLKSMYVSKPVHIEGDIIIGGQVTTSDREGNVYRSIYIQDNTGGIEIKIGKTGLYNVYKIGQWVYVKCQGLTLGAYEGMLQIGVDDPTGEYETSYMDVSLLIDQHVFKGKKAEPVLPAEVQESNLLASENMGRYVLLKGLKYGNQVFCLMYPDQNGNKKLTSNRVFLSDKTWGITTWAMSANKMREYLNSGVWDTAALADGSQTVKELREAGKMDIVANYVSHYFKMGGTDVQIRTSGYAKFADTELDPDVLSGAKSINITGILTNYRGAAQFTLVSIEGVEIVQQ